MNNAALYFKDTNDSNINGLYFDTANTLHIGKGLPEKGYSTQIFGKEIRFLSGASSATAMRITSDVAIRARTILPLTNLEYNLGNPDNS